MCSSPASSRLLTPPTSTRSGRTRKPVKHYGTMVDSDGIEVPEDEDELWQRDDEDDDESYGRKKMKSEEVGSEEGGDDEEEDEDDLVSDDAASDEEEEDSKAKDRGGKAKKEVKPKKGMKTKSASTSGKAKVATTKGKSKMTMERFAIKRQGTPASGTSSKMSAPKKIELGVKKSGASQPSKRATHISKRAKPKDDAEEADEEEEQDDDDEEEEKSEVKPAPAVAKKPSVKSGKVALAAKAPAPAVVVSKAKSKTFSKVALLPAGKAPSSNASSSKVNLITKGAKPIAIGPASKTKSGQKPAPTASLKGAKAIKSEPEKASVTAAKKEKESTPEEEEEDDDVDKDALKQTRHLRDKEGSEGGIKAESDGEDNDDGKDDESDASPTPKGRKANVSSVAKISKEPSKPHSPKEKVQEKPRSKVARKETPEDSDGEDMASDTEQVDADMEIDGQSSSEAASQAPTKRRAQHNCLYEDDLPNSQASCAPPANAPKRKRSDQSSAEDSQSQSGKERSAPADKITQPYRIAIIEAMMQAKFSKHIDFTKIPNGDAAKLRRHWRESLSEDMKSLFKGKGIRANSGKVVDTATRKKIWGLACDQYEKLDWEGVVAEGDEEEGLEEGVMTVTKLKRHFREVMRKEGEKALSR